jgi:PAS domain S-box-containing protein
MTGLRSNRPVVLHRDVVENSIQGTMVITDEGVVYANQVVAEMTGYSVRELEAFSLDDLWAVIHEEDRQTMMKRREDRLANRPVPERYEFRFLHKTNGERLLEVKPTVVNLEQGPVVQAYVVDKSDRWLAEQTRVEIERQLCHARKMEAVGKLAGGVAHDFKNNLFVITTNLEILKKKAQFRGAEFERLTLIERAARDASELASQLLRYAHPSEDKSETVLVNVSELLDEVVRMLENTFRKEITVIKRVLVDKPLIWGDPGQLRQVFMNLVLNARDAMPDGGELRLTVWQQATNNGERLSQDTVSERYLIVAVSDTGIGIPEEIRSRIFEPFFTTKEKDRGTGMGLAMAFEIVRSHYGSIDVESVPGEGTTFVVRFPYAESDD